MNRIKEARKEKRLTVFELGDLVGVTGVTISRYETGQRKPSIMMAYKLAKALGVTIDDLFGREKGESA